MVMPKIEEGSRRAQKVQIEIMWLEGSYEGQMAAINCKEVYYVHVNYRRKMVSSSGGL